MSSLAPIANLWLSLGNFTLRLSLASICIAVPWEPPSLALMKISLSEVSFPTYKLSLKTYIFPSPPEPNAISANVAP